ncbi:hypothetical protein BG004_002389, partial [Podila humilis]
MPDSPERQEKNTSARARDTETNTMGSNDINITITPSSRPPTADTTNAQHGSHITASPPPSPDSSSSSISFFEDGYEYHKRQKHGRHVQGLPKSAMAIVDAVLQRNNHEDIKTISPRPMYKSDLSKLDVQVYNDKDQDEDEDEARYRRDKGEHRSRTRGQINSKNNNNAKSITKSHDLGQTPMIAPVQPHRQVKHMDHRQQKKKASRLSKNHQGRHKSHTQSQQDHSEPSSPSSDSITMKDALYPQDDPLSIPESNHRHVKRSPMVQSSRGQPSSSSHPHPPHPRPLSQEQVQMYRTVTCASEISSDMRYVYDDEKDPGYIINWPLFLPDRETEQQIVQKLDRNLLPLLGILYLFSYLDRVNIGNARLFGLEEAVHLTDGQYNIALATFFVAYCLFEIPSNWMLVRIGPRSWIPLLMLICLALAWVTSFTALAIARFALGTAEAGFVPGVLYYITLFYKRSEQSFRIAIFLCFNILAGAFGGLLAAGISNLHGQLGLQGWQWIFIIEAVPTILLAFLSWILMTPSPSVAKFLTVDERIYASNRILMESDVLPTKSASWRQTKEALTDYRIYLMCIINLFLLLPNVGVTLFLPSLVKDMGFTATTAQLLTVPPYMVAAAFSLVMPWYSDRIRVRGLFGMTLPWISLVGFLILALAPWKW